MDFNDKLLIAECLFKGKLVDGHIYLHDNETLIDVNKFDPIENIDDFILTIDYMNSDSHRKEIDKRLKISHRDDDLFGLGLSTFRWVYSNRNKVINELLKILKSEVSVSE